MEESIALEEPGIEEAEPDIEVNSQEDETEIEGEAVVTDTDEESAEGEGPEENEEPEEMEEYSFGGDKLSVPKGSIPEEVSERLKKFTEGTWQSFSEKSQRIAEQAKELEAQQGAVEQLQSLNTELLNDYSVGQALASRLDELQQIQVDWNASPDHARQVSDEINKVSAAFNQSLERVRAGRSALDQQKQAALEQQRQAGEKAINEAIPEFSSKHKDAVIAYAVAQGVPEATAKAEWNVNPFATKMAYKAMKYDQMIAKAKTKPKPGVKQAKVSSSTRKGKGGTGHQDPEKMSTEEYIKWRRNGGG